MFKTLRHVARDEQGAALVEYGLLVGLIAVVCITAIGILGTNVNDIFCYINNQMAGNAALVAAGVVGC
jgi:pilus assembly protein Flp/PilA